RAADLAARVRAAFPATTVRLGDTPDARYDVAINATSLGMKIRDELPMSRDLVERAALVADCVVAPEMTGLLALAASRGRAFHTGVPMLEAQMSLMLEFMGVQ
ncbi:MAG TPA: shikimate dehydrogenase, partial [Candidatus Eisenbacteria bacterium]|nr:shikimate dehydrogenase [Candidatus Eisenbacteria bacterium]